MTFSHIGNYLPKFSKYLDGADASACVSKMVKKKKGGKELVKFFDKAVKRDEWKSDAVFKSLLECAVTKSSKLSKKEKAKFKKIEKTFSAKVKGIKAATPTVPQPIVQPKPVVVKQPKPIVVEQPKQVETFNFDQEAYKHLKAPIMQPLPEKIKTMRSEDWMITPSFTYAMYIGRMEKVVFEIELQLAVIRAQLYLKANGKAYFDDPEVYKIYKDQVVKEFVEEVMPHVHPHYKTAPIQYQNATNQLEMKLDEYKAKLQYGM